MLPEALGGASNLAKSYINSVNPQIFEAYISKVYFRNKSALRARLLRANAAAIRARMQEQDCPQENSLGEKRGPW